MGRCKHRKISLYSRGRQIYWRFVLNLLSRSNQGASRRVSSARIDRVWGRGDQCGGRVCGRCGWSRGDWFGSGGVGTADEGRGAKGWERLLTQSVAWPLDCILLGKGWDIGLCSGGLHKPGPGQVAPCGCRAPGRQFGWEKLLSGRILSSRTRKCARYFK
jgi:hypothetical protein